MPKSTTSNNEEGRSNLSDSAFAIVETANGKKVRALLHHTDGKLDLPLLRKALARANQVEGVSEAVKEAALAHLRAHAQSAGVGEQKAATEFSAQFYSIHSIELKEGENGRKISELQVLPEGKFQHPWYGELDFTAPVLRAAKRNFDSNILGTDIMVDEGHDRGKALGWYKELHYGKRTVGEQDFQGLWGTIEWTELGEELLAKQLYKYFSAEIGSWTGPGGKKVPNVLLGGALTNRPFFKQMPAVKLSEGQIEDRFVIGLFGDEQWTFELPTGSQEEEHEFHTGFGIPDDKEEEDEMDELIAEINEKFKKNFTSTEEVLAFIGDMDEGGQFAEKFRTAFGALGIEFKNGEDPIAAVAKAFKAAKDQSAELTGRVTTIEQQLTDQAFETAFSSNLRAGKVVPAQKEKMKKLFDTDRKLFDELMEVTEGRTTTFGDHDMGTELGSIGVAQEPGQEGQFKDANSEETQKEAKRYAALEAGRKIEIPGLAAARNGREN